MQGRAQESGHIARISAYQKVVNFEQISIRKWPHAPLDRGAVFLEVCIWSLIVAIIGSIVVLWGYHALAGRR
jgi:hypothetical protein